MSRIDTPRTNTASRWRSSLLPEPTPRALIRNKNMFASQYNSASTRSMPLGTDQEPNRGRHTTRLTPKHDPNFSSRRSARDFGTPVYKHQSQVQEPEKIKNSLDALQERAIQRANEIERLTAELDSVLKRKEHMRKNAFPMNTGPNAWFQICKCGILFRIRRNWVGHLGGMWGWC